MKKYSRPLTSNFVERRDLRPGKYLDRDGLYLRVRKSGRKYWEHRFRVNGDLRTMGLGPFPVLSLNDARHLVRRNLVLVYEGQNPFPDRGTAPVPTVDALVPPLIGKLSPDWKNPKEPSRWRDLFRLHVSPVIGNRLVCDVERYDLLRVLSPLWTRKHPTALKVRVCLNALFDQAVSLGYIAANPVDDALSSALPRDPTKRSHFPAAPPAKVVTVLNAVDRADASLATKLSLRFQVLTASRLGEVRAARWSDIDRKACVWTIPADRMKTSKEHRVPLSTQALALLDEAHLLGGADGLIFPSPRGGMLSDGTHSKLVRKLGFKWVPHGFRSSFRDWCAMNEVPREVAEASLAHQVGNEVERSYSRSVLLERRRPVLQKWANYLDDATRVLTDLDAQSDDDS